MPNKFWGMLKLDEDNPNKTENQYPKEIFFKVIERNNIEDTNYTKIKNERTNILSKIIEFLIDKYKDDEIKKEQFNNLKNQINNEQDLFYRILKKKEQIWEEIYENIAEKEYSIEEIKNALDKVNKDEPKYNEELLKAYYIKLWCFNFIAFNYPQNEELTNLLISQNEEKINKLKTERERDLDNKTYLDNNCKIIYLEKGNSLHDLVKELKNNKIEDKSKLQLLFQKIMKQILIGLYLIHHLSKDECLYHNDLKPGNILMCFYQKDDNNKTSLIDKYMNATYKIVDLDLTRQIKYTEIDQEYSNRMYKNNIFPYDDPDKEEIYEVGEILWELITKEYHFIDDKANLDLKKKYLKKNCIINKSEKLCKSTIKFLHRCLQTDRKFRITCDGALDQEFFKQKDFNKYLDFKDIPKDLISQDGNFFYLPIYRPFLGLEKHEMKEDEDINVDF